MKRKKKKIHLIKKRIKINRFFKINIYKSNLEQLNFEKKKKNLNPFLNLLKKEMKKEIKIFLFLK